MIYWINNKKQLEIEHRIEPGSLNLFSFKVQLCFELKARGPKTSNLSPEL